MRDEERRVRERERDMRVLVGWHRERGSERDTTAWRARHCRNEISCRVDIARVRQAESERHTQTRASEREREKWAEECCRGEAPDRQGQGEDSATETATWRARRSGNELSCRAIVGCVRVRQGELERHTHTRAKSEGERGVQREVPERQGNGREESATWRAHQRGSELSCRAAGAGDGEREGERCEG